MNVGAPGSQVAGRYRVVRVLGSGGMGLVVEATHLQLAQRVAIKFMLPGLCSQRDAVGRFLREARATVKIESEHVARVTDVGTTEEGAPFLVMEYLEGSDVAELLRQQKRLSVAQAVSLVAQACDAIAEAHSVGIIHRDLKPSNLFLATRRDGTKSLKVLDFGISKALSEVPESAGVATRTATATVLGSPHYMSPEQLRSSKNVDPRTDIWSLGVILHELLTGEAPFRGESLPGVLASIVADPPASLRSARPDVPLGLEAVVARCLEKERTQRYASIPELARALLPFAPSDAQAVLQRVQTFAKVEQATLSLGPLPAPKGPPPAPPTTPRPPVVADTERGLARALGPLQEGRYGAALAVLLAGLACGFAYLAYRAEARVPSVAPVMTASGASLQLAEQLAEQTSRGPTRVTIEPLTSARWESLQRARFPEVVGPAPALTTSLDDPKLFVDRQ